MIFRWIGRALLMFLGRKAWESYQRRGRSTNPGTPRHR